MKLRVLLSATALTSAALIATLPGAAYAQSAPANVPPTTAQDKEEQKEETASADGSISKDNSIVVTGSRIRRPESDGVLPGVQVTAQSIETRGFTNALEALNDIPLVGPGASPLNGNNGGQTASLGAAFVDLLDLGTARTLTLVNGRRFVSGNSASLFVAGNETGSQVDINVIPSSLIERVDVVTVGGAAAYGADAIAGVVNFILKDNYNGFQARALAGVSERGDAGQYQISALGGHNFFDGRANLTLSFEYSRNDGLQAVARDFRNVRPGSYTNPFNGGIRNPSFTPTSIVDVTNLNNGAFLRASDDGQPSTLFGLGFVTQTLSNPGTVLLSQSNTYYTPYTPITSGSGATLRTSNYITFANGVAPVGFALNATNTTGGRTTIAGSINNGFFSFSAAQIIQGTPGAGAISGNGLNGASAQATGVPFTTFAPTSLPANVTAASVLAAYGVTAPTGATAAQLTTLAVNILQANRFTAREFLAANPTTNLNYFIGTFDPAVPRVANTDTTLVSVRVNGANVMVPVNQILPFRAVPLQFNDNGTLQEITFSGPISGNAPITVGSSVGGNAGFNRSLENTVLRTQQDRYVVNLLGHFDITDNLTFFSENTYANVLNRSLGNIAGSQNFITNTQENAALLVNINNPFLTAQNRSVLNSVGIATGNGTNNGNFLITRQNQDVVGANEFVNRQETFRITAGLKWKFGLLGKSWNAELSGTYGDSRQNTRSYGIADVEYQLALDAVDAGVAAGGAANGNIVCRSKLFPSQYLGRTPNGTAENITRVRGADGLPTEVLVTPVITQALIDACQPLNPFGYNQMSQASKDYVISPSLFRNVSKQTYIVGSVGGQLFDLPAGPLAVSVNAEYRRDSLSFTTNELNILGRSRSAPSANTTAYTRTFEGGGELAIPLTGPDFLPFVGSLEFRPALRVTQQSGAAASYRNLAGQVITPKAEGKVGTIYSLAGTWRPIRDIQFRGNFTRSLRQPSIVELFLGGQPTFQAVTDLCGPANINNAANNLPRAANCAAAVIANGNATDVASANTFLANFVPQGGSLQGTFSGSPTLKPERGESWTAGAALTPRWIPGLTISGDYISLNLKDQIVTAGVGTFLQACYDSPTYPDSTAQIGLNGCSRFTRGADFQLQNGVQAGFLNLGGIQVRAVNATVNYSLKLGTDRVVLRANAYHLIRYDTSASGTFNGDRAVTAGTYSRPTLETQLSVRYEHDWIYGQVTWNRQSPTRIFAGNDPAGPEVYPYNRYPALHNVDLALGLDVNDKFRLQLNVSNVLDQTTAGALGYTFADYYDQIGRRFQASVTTRF
ncbi:TonB-dependent receptor domain-containing protein [Sphingomonas sp. MMS24-J45]|uniref:TonB-dependent receptor domain-containing protein n=1 Tax=Sphingomonas sp. MMS24-J45 TaxID=3238806 RepID=UPI00384BE98E